MMRGSRGGRGGRGSGGGPHGLNSSALSLHMRGSAAQQYDPYSGYEDDYDYAYAGKRPIDERDPMGVKRQRTSSMQMMNMMIQDSQRELANLTFDNTSRPRRPDSDHLSQVLNRQQMLLEMQSEMIAGMGGRPGGAKAGLEDAYYSGSVGARASVDPYGAEYGKAGTSSYGKGGARGAARGKTRGGAYKGIKDEYGHGGRGGRMGGMGRDIYYDYPREPEMAMYDHNPYLDYEYDDGMGGPAPEYFVSIEGKINNFIRVLFQYEDLYSPVQAIETSRHDNTDLVKIRTEYNCFEDMDKDPYISGHLKINGVMLAREEGYTKHQVKDAVYAKALHMLMAKSVSEIFANSNKVYKEVPEKERKTKSDPKEGKGKRDHKFILSRLKELVTSLREDFPQSFGRGYKENLIHEMDLACGNSDAGITLVYIRNDDESITCELYADDLMIGSGEESEKRSAMRNAYRNAKRLLMNWNMPVDRIVRENKRLQNADILDPKVIDIQYKAKNHERGSNLNFLKTMNPDIFTEDFGKKREVVTYELADESNTMPYKALEDTACANRMLLEFVVYCGMEGGPTRCLIFLQGDLIADAKGFNRVKAKSNAAQKGLQYLRQYCSLIKTSPRDYKNPALNFDKAKEKALLLKADSPELARDWDLSSYPAPSPNDPKPDDLSPWVDQVLESLVKEYSVSEGLEEVILDKDFPKYHITRLKEISKKYKTHVIVKRGDEKQARSNCVIIQKDVFKVSDPIEVVQLLRKLNNTSGRYRLIQYKDENDELVKC